MSLSCGKKSIYGFARFTFWCESGRRRTYRLKIDMFPFSAFMFLFWLFSGVVFSFLSFHQFHTLSKNVQVMKQKLIRKPFNNTFQSHVYAALNRIRGHFEWFITIPLNMSSIHQHLQFSPFYLFKFNQNVIVESVQFHLRFYNRIFQFVENSIFCPF